MSYGMKKTLVFCFLLGIGSKMVMYGSNVMDTRSHLLQMRVDLN